MNDGACRIEHMEPCSFVLQLIEPTIEDCVIVAEILLITASLISERCPR